MENRIKSDFEKTFKDSLSKNELVAKGENLKSFLKDYRKRELSLRY